MAFIMEQAGGMATTGTTNILDIQPENIHQRVPVVMGSPDDVQEYISIFQKHHKWRPIVRETQNNHSRMRDQNVFLLSKKLHNVDRIP